MQEEISYIEYKKLFEDSEKRNREKDIRIEHLAHELNQLKRLIFGAKSEKFLPQIKQNQSQLTLDMQQEEPIEIHIEKEQTITYTKTKSSVVEKPHKGRNDLPEHLERRVQIIEPDIDLQGCRKIGEEVTEELEYEPGKLFVNRTVRPRYVKESTNEIIIAEMIERALPKTIAGPSLLSQILIDKYVDHLPLHRQIERFKRDNVTIAYSTISDWVRQSVEKVIVPIYHCLKQKILESQYLHVDETPLKVLDINVKNKTHLGYLWVYHDSINRRTLFDYNPSRGREAPRAMLKDFKGYLQTDGYSVYNLFKEQEGISVMHCMAHARRMFFEAQGGDKHRSQFALALIGKLYDFERKMKSESLGEGEIYIKRQEEAKPILQELETWMKEQIMEVLPKSIIGKAIAYSLSRWPELCKYTEHGYLNIDNNSVENSIRPVALGRKNYLFAGSHKAAERNAMIYSIVGTCKINEINPFEYIKDIITRTPTYPINKIENLLPENWKNR